MTLPLDSTLVLCDLDELLLDENGNLPLLVRDVLTLFCSRGGKFTVFSQRAPRAVRSLLGGVQLGAPALLCGGNLAYDFSAGTGQPLRTFEALGAGFGARLPAAAGVGIALQMRDGTTRVLRMSRGLEKHLRQEWTPFLLGSAADAAGADVLRVLLYQDDKSVPMLSLLEKALGPDVARLRVERIAPDTLVLTPSAVAGAVMLDAVCLPSMLPPDQAVVAAGGMAMLELVRAAKHSVAAADAPAELRLAAERTTFTDHAGGAAAEVLYGLVRRAERAPK